MNKTKQKIRRALADGARMAFLAGLTSVLILVVAVITGEPLLTAVTWVTNLLFCGAAAMACGALAMSALLFLDNRKTK